MLDALQQLATHCRVKRDEWFMSEAHVLTFQFGRAITTIRLASETSVEDLEITNMTTFPVAERGKGHGARAVRILVDWALRNGRRNITAVQVSNEKAENFWKKNGFVPAGNRTNDFVYKGLS